MQGKRAYLKRVMHAHVKISLAFNVGYRPRFRALYSQARRDTIIALTYTDPHRQVEAMAQLGGLVCLQEPCSDGKGVFFFSGVDGVSYSNQYGETCTIVTVKPDRGLLVYEVLSNSAYCRNHIIYPVFCDVPQQYRKVLRTLAY